jgi:histidinol-phosphate/aromatic aminotransferase/cobyric acid decarboxylase-like protein
VAARQPRWSVNGLAGAALADLLATVDLTAWSQETARLRRALVAVLQARGWSPAPSDANWVLVPGPGLRDQLAGQAILVRDCATFGLAGTVRIAVPGDAGLDRLADALARLPAPDPRGSGCPA